MSTLNERAWQLCDAMVADAASLGVVVHTLNGGTRIVDCGVKATGGVEAGLRLAEVCMAGIGTCQPCELDPKVWHGAGICTDVPRDPVPACMASQYAGWAIKGEKFFAMGSGPMRAAACGEELFQDIGNCEKPDRCVGVLETGKLPPEAVCIDVADKCGVSPDRLTLLAAATSSVAGTVQIVARSVETALHKLHVLKFDLDCIESGRGIAPMPPASESDIQALGRTNDAILYGATVELTVKTNDETLSEIGPRVPSNSSTDYGQPFETIFNRYGGDFYAIDSLLFSPAKITFRNLTTGNDFTFGQFAPDVLAGSFAQKK
jgi:methenyltetrahydromethanopterin cyclohydrolase